MQNYTKVFRYTFNNSDTLSLLDLMFATVGVLLTLMLIFCLLGLCIKLSDLKMKSYVLELANKRGVKVDLDTIERKRNCQSPLTNENCAVFVPDSDCHIVWSLLDIMFALKDWQNFGKSTKEKIQQDFLGHVEENI